MRVGYRSEDNGALRWAKIMTLSIYLDKVVCYIRWLGHITISLYLDFDLFLIYVVAFNICLDSELFLFKKAQFAYLKIDKAFIIVSSK